MKQMKKKIGAFLLISILVIGNVIPVSAAEMSGFPMLSSSSYTSRYAKAIQVMMLNYNSTTRRYITQTGGADGSYGQGTVNAVQRNRTFI
ncbi:hypothetical protein MCG98_18280 [Ruminococcus sp. OA3]|uniref:hypothetical protein n=1 Tax=Ruminococcus sp. OA3 TaxID=2914164 RepID=UPI001F06FAC9|nr:hypothetical protein [Ruminococcus sp. OA3]MCH1984504.1 hypothetical protein [Ruminococcus sp. OA3]